MSSIDYNYLYSLARSSIDHGLLHAAALYLNPKFIDPIYLTEESTYVSLSINNKNIGCIGNALNKEFFYNSILKNAFKAAFDDDRFAPLNKNSFTKTQIQIHHLLSEGERKLRVNSLYELLPLINKNDSLQLLYGNKKPLMLSFVQRNFKSLTDYILATMDKGSIPKTANVWSNIEIRLIPTFIAEKHKLSEIPPCQNYI